MDLEEAIRTRHSVPKLGGDVDDPTIDALIALAVTAPNHHETEPWTFTVLRGVARERIGRRWAEALAAEKAIDAQARATFVDGEARKLGRAPVVIAVSTRTDADPVVASEDFAATAAAVQNLLLAAHARGLGAIWRTGAMAAHPAMRELLGLAPADRIVAMVYLGVPSQAPEPRAARRSDVVRRISV